ncbi:MAG: hypothetical protein ACK5YW_09175 [Betaproteobacteria bacterium]|jgi:hypothetical protein|nr:hypothetical protein [Rhodocyclaceae bacterium]MCE2898303.1 hypothetical protein [Betaproteobacteria bacterium]
MASPLENALRLVRPGEMVVPVSDILDKLGSKLTATEKEQLLIAILSRRTDQVKPGDLITAGLLNQLLADVADLQVRVLSLQSIATDGKGGTQPIPGDVTIGYKGSKKGIKVVPGDPSPTEHTFGVSNGTFQSLPILLTARVTDASGDWSKAAYFSNNRPSITITVPQGTRVSVDAFVVAPAGAILGEKPRLKVSAQAGLAPNLNDEGEVALQVSNALGDEVVRTFALENVLMPRDFASSTVGIDGRIPKTEDRTLTFKFKYDDNSATPPDPGFVLIVKLEEANPAYSLDKWFVMPMGGTADSDETLGGVRTFTKRGVNLPRGQPTPVEVTLTAPDANTKVRCTFTVRSSKLQEAIEASRSFVIESN